jgi:hypothetical protein
VADRRRDGEPEQEAEAEEEPIASCSERLATTLSPRSTAKAAMYETIAHPPDMSRPM